MRRTISHKRKYKVNCVRRTFVYVYGHSLTRLRLLSFTFSFSCSVWPPLIHSIVFRRAESICVCVLENALLATILSVVPWRLLSNDIRFRAACMCAMNTKFSKTSTHTNRFSLEYGVHIISVLIKPMKTHACSVQSFWTFRPKNKHWRAREQFKLLIWQKKNSRIGSGAL